MIRNSIGYIILEGSNGASDPETVQVVTNKSTSGRVYCTAIFQTANERNRNGRWYNREDLAREIACERTQELIKAKALRSEQGHPMDTALARQAVIWEPNCSCIILDLHMEGDNVAGTFTNTSNEKGKALAEEILELNYRPAFSLRALGSLQQTSKGAEVKGLRLICYDEVVYPSHKSAYAQEILPSYNNVNVTNNTNVATESVTESGILLPNKDIALSETKLIPMTDESVIDYIQSESSNLKFVRECFDYRYNDIKVSENGTKVILSTHEGDTLVINLENYIHNELMKYAVKNI